MGPAAIAIRRERWDKGRIVGQKAPLKPKDVGALRGSPKVVHRVRELALMARFRLNSVTEACFLSDCACRKQSFSKRRLDGPFAHQCRQTAPP